VGLGSFPYRAARAIGGGPGGVLAPMTGGRFRRVIGKADERAGRRSVVPNVRFGLSGSSLGSGRCRGEPLSPFHRHFFPAAALALAALRWKSPSKLRRLRRGWHRGKPSGRIT
jgi:hypothetical protein